MKLPLVLVLLALAIVGTGLAVSSLKTGEEPRSSAVEDRVEQLSIQLAELQGQVQELSSASTGSRRDLATPSQRMPTLSDEAISAAVSRWLEANPPEVTTLTSMERDILDLESMSLSDLVELVIDDSLTADQLQELWSRLAKSGRSDDVIAELERMAENAPHDPDAQIAIGQAYLYKIFEVGSGPLAGEYATKADDAFGRAIELDDTNYEARMMKAVSLSHWPAFLGKTSQAISEFETLVSMQGDLSTDQRSADPYLILGNMYLQTGERDKALAAWRNGLGSFPDHAGLLEQLALNE